MTDTPEEMGVEPISDYGLPNCPFCNAAMHLCNKSAPHNPRAWRVECTARWTGCPINFRTHEGTKDEAAAQWRKCAPESRLSLALAELEEARSLLENAQAIAGYVVQNTELASIKETPQNTTIKCPPDFWKIAVETDSRARAFLNRNASKGGGDGDR